MKLGLTSTMVDLTIPLFSSQYAESRMFSACGDENSSNKTNQDQGPPLGSLARALPGPLPPQAAFATRPQSAAFAMCP